MCLHKYASVDGDIVICINESLNFGFHMYSFYEVNF